MPQLFGAMAVIALLYIAFWVVLACGVIYITFSVLKSLYLWYVEEQEIKREIKKQELLEIQNEIDEIDKKLRR